MDSPSTSQSPSSFLAGGDDSNPGGTAASSSTGTLRVKMKLREGAGAVTAVSPFYLMKNDLPAAQSLSGSSNLIAHHGLHVVFNRLHNISERLSAFLPNVPGNIDSPNPMRPDNDDSSSLRALIEKPPIVGKDIAPLTSSQLAAFKLTPTPLPANYRAFCDSITGEDSVKKNTNLNTTASSNNNQHSFANNRQKRSLNEDTLETEVDPPSKKRPRKEEDRAEKKKEKKKKKDKKKKN